jgi:hypothetical protein
VLALEKFQLARFGAIALFGFLQMALKSFEGLPAVTA